MPVVRHLGFVECENWEIYCSVAPTPYVVQNVDQS